MSLLDALSHLSNLSTPVLVVLGVLYIRNQILQLKLWIINNFEPKERTDP